ncbi:hypothetical protein QOZ80_5BG0440320 [Eleusine coracana subsp. coracana]|nr:hypothetical protein QOZ80_5BG0440320 [Eleusine coracana subsp. coracana]
MDGKKVNLQWIAHDSTRRSTLKKRSNALMKKASKLATLCGAKVSVVVYGEEDAMPLVYPSVPEARQLLSRFKAMPDDLENLKKVLNQEEYLRARISKLQEQKRKMDQKKHEHETSQLLVAAMAGHGSSLPSLTIEELTSLNGMVEKRIRNAKAHFEQIMRQRNIQEPLVGPQEKPKLSSQLQAPYPSMKMQTQAPVEELQPLVQDLFADLAWTGGKLNPCETSNTNGGGGPSSSGVTKCTITI